MKNIIMFTMVALSVVRCSGEENADSTPMPANLVVQVTPLSDGTGTVNVVATADNTNFYYIYFNEQENETPLVSFDGTGSYTYANSGTYTVKVQAHASVGKYISKSASVIVEIPEVINIPAEGYTTPLSYDGMQLVWNDEFDGTTLNTEDWTYEIGIGNNGWGNNELQYYRSENTSLHEGNLIITARKENFGGRNYTSSRLKTQDKKVFQYGRIDIRAALPKGQGIWPALWMLGNNISSVGWPACGEIDIMELVGGSTGDRTVYGTVHWDEGGHACNCEGSHSYALSSGTFNDEFHVFSIVWTDSNITWYVDDTQFATIDITSEARSELKGESFLIFNVAVGGDWPGSPDASTVFPQRMIVDYVRVFQTN